MKPIKYDFPSIVKGTWFDGLELEFNTATMVDGVPTDIQPHDITDVIFKMDFKRTDKVTDHKKSITNGAGITILATNKIGIDGFVVTMDTFNYLYDLKMTYPADRPKVYMKGIFPVEQNTTD